MIDVDDVMPVMTRASSHFAWAPLLLLSLDFHVRMYIIITSVLTLFNNTLIENQADWICLL